MENTKKIINSFKEQLPMVKEVMEVHNKCFNSRRGILKLASELAILNGVFFKNLHNTKLNVGKTKVDGSHYWYREKNAYKLIFLNTLGISFSDVFFEGDNENNIAQWRSGYLQNLPDEEFIKGLVYIHNFRKELLSLINPAKKSILTRFFKAYEEAGCPNVLGIKDFDRFEVNFEDEPLKIEYYSDGVINEVNVSCFNIDGASRVIYVNKNDNRMGERVGIEDLERVSQIHMEVITFLNNYFVHLDRQRVVLDKFYGLLKCYFAKEVILNSLSL